MGTHLSDLKVSITNWKENNVFSLLVKAFIDISIELEFLYCFPSCRYVLCNFPSPPISQVCLNHLCDFTCTAWPFVDLHHPLLPPKSRNSWLYVCQSVNCFQMKDLHIMWLMWLFLFVTMPPLTHLFKCGDLHSINLLKLATPQLLLTEWNGAFKLTGVLSLSWSICKRLHLFPELRIWSVSKDYYRVRTLCSLPLLARQELFTLLVFTSLCLFVISMLRVQTGEQGRQSRAVEVALWPLPFLPVSHLCPLISRHRHVWLLLKIRHQNGGQNENWPCLVYLRISRT